MTVLRLVTAVCSATLCACGATGGELPKGAEPAGGAAAAVTPAAVEGDLQAGVPAAPVRFPPVVRVADELDLPVAGIPVHFAVTSGGGSVEIADAVTGVDGRASAGQWILGSAGGLQEVTAWVGSAGPVTFRAFAVRTSPELSIDLWPTPSPLLPMGDDMILAVDVRARGTIASVVGTNLAETRPLAPTIGPQPWCYDSACLGWEASFSNAALPSGWMLVVATATDTAGNVTDWAGQLDLDRPPRITFATPIPDGGEVGRYLDVDASCTDAERTFCEQFEMGVSPDACDPDVDPACQRDPYDRDPSTGEGRTYRRVLSSVVGRLRGRVQLSRYEGQDIRLLFRAMDAHFQTVTVARRAHVVASPGTPAPGAGAPAALTMVAGDLQVAGPGEALPVPLRVQVVDAAGTPVAGAPVRCTPGAASGTVEPAEVVSAADGIAECGGWVLGTAAGLQTLAASSGPSAEVTFRALALRTSPNLSVSLHHPTPLRPVKDEMEVLAFVHAAAPIASVVGTNCVETKAFAPFDYPYPACADCTRWLGWLCNEELPSGSTPVVVTATDTAGGVADAGVWAWLDRPPEISIAAPTPEWGRHVPPILDVDATCTDAEGPCARFELRRCNPASWECDVTHQVILATTEGRIARRIDLFPWTHSYWGTYIVLAFVGTDSAGQVVTRMFGVHADGPLEPVPGP